MVASEETSRLAILDHRDVQHGLSSGRNAQPLIIERENLLENAHERGLQFLSELQPLLDLPVVGDVHGLGLALGVELVSDKKARTPLALDDPTLVTRFREDTGVILGLHGHTLVITPPLIIRAEEVSRTVKAVTHITERLSTDGTYRR